MSHVTCHLRHPPQPQTYTIDNRKKLAVVTNVSKRNIETKENTMLVTATQENGISKKNWTW